jgi:6-pyruvoyltetrahydropterin/6-carboxytetrahydropterin synthase
MYYINVSFHFSAAHRLEGHPKCGRLHGHNYIVEVTLGSAETSPMGFVMDFADAKAIIKPIVDQCDHKYLVSHNNMQAGDHYAAAAREWHPEDIMYMPMHQTSAENMACFFKTEIKEALEMTDVKVKEVKVWETKNNWAKV